MTDYSFCGNITIYAAAGSLGDTLSESDYKNNILWSGTLYFPHATADSGTWIASLPNNYYLSRGSNWDTARQYIPAFASANGVFNTNGQSALYSASYSGYFPGMTGVYPGFANKPLHIVTCRKRQNAYVYQTPIAGDGGAVYAEIQDNGDIIMDTAKRLVLPRFAATSSYAYLYGCLFIGGVTDDNQVTGIHDFQINAAWREPTLAGLHIALFNQVSSAHAATVAFLNQWPLNKGFDPDGGGGDSGGGFDLKSFLAGVAVGRQLKGWATRRE